MKTEQVHCAARFAAGLAPRGALVNLRRGDLSHPAAPWARHGFTLIELMVVISIIAVLIAILLPSLNKARDRARLVVCTSNERQLAAAWLMYAMDHHGLLVQPSNNTSEHWIDRPSNHGGDVEAGIRAGAFYRIGYIQTLGVYHCPADRSGYLTPSYSISVALGYNAASYGGVTIRKTLGEIARAADTLVSIEEYDPRGDGSAGAWVCLQAPYTCYVNADWFARWHDDAYTLSFADGHAGYQMMLNPGSASLGKLGDVVPASNEDWQWLWAHYKTW